MAEAGSRLGHDGKHAQRQVAMDGLCPPALVGLDLCYSVVRKWLRLALGRVYRRELPDICNAVSVLYGSIAPRRTAVRAGYRGVGPGIASLVSEFDELFHFWLRAAAQPRRRRHRAYAWRGCLERLLRCRSLLLGLSVAADGVDADGGVHHHHDHQCRDDERGAQCAASPVARRSAPPCRHGWARTDRT